MTTRRNQAAAKVASARKQDKLTVASTARLRYLRASAQKTRLVVDQIRGLRVDEARAYLMNDVKRVSRDLLKLLMSAQANTESRGAASFDQDDLYVSRAWVDEGPMMKRSQPAPMGRAYPIHKRTCHVTIELGSLSGPLPAARGRRGGRGARPAAS